MALQSLPGISWWLRLAGILFCLGEAVLKYVSSNDDFRRDGGRRTTEETADMLMKQFPQRSGQSSDKVICIAMAPDSEGGAGAGLSALAFYGVLKDSGDGALEMAGGRIS